MKFSGLKRWHKAHVICVAVLCFCFLGIFFGGDVLASAGAKVATYIDKTYDFEKGRDDKILTDAEGKKALTPEIDALILAAGRDTGRTAVTDAEFSTYLGYVNYLLRNGNGNYRAEDFLRCALAVGAAGGDPAYVGKDVNGNRVDLFYKGLYSRSLATLEKEGIKTVAYALLALDANGISDGEMRSCGSKVDRSQLKTSLIVAAKKLASQGVPDVGTSASVLSALAPYYLNGESEVVTAADGLLKKLSGLQGADGSVKDSPTATAETLIALCAMGIDPTSNDWFDYDIYHGLQSFYCANGGYAATAGGSASQSVTATVRCGLVAYLCYQEDGLFYDFSAVKHHDVKNIPSPKASTSTSQKNTTTSAGAGEPRKKQSVSNSPGSSGSSGKKSAGIPSAASGTAEPSKETKAVAPWNIIEKAVFENIKGTDETYVYDGIWCESEPYTLTFKGTDVTVPMDFNPEISSAATHQMEIDATAVDAEYIVFHHAGAFPGKAMADITVSVPDGSFQCYHYDDAVGKFEEVSTVTVASGKVSFPLDVGGEYFITAASVATAGHTFDMDDTVNGVVPASVFEDLSGKDVDLTLNGVTGNGVRYEIIFHGSDITAPMDFDMRMTEESDNAEAIGALAKDPAIFHFRQDGTLPGKATVNVYLTLEQKPTYGLYYFNADYRQGEYCGPVTLAEDFISFTIDHCSDYFIADYDGKDVLTPLPGSSLMLPVSVVLVVLLILVAVGAVLWRCYGKEGLKAKGRQLLGRVSLGKKKATASDSAGPLTETEIAKAAADSSRAGEDFPDK